MMKQPYSVTDSLTGSWRDAARIKKRLWLCFPAVALCLLDLAVTLWNQSPGYWNGNYLFVIEANPVSYFFLAAHPLLYLIGSAAWLVSFSLLILLLPGRLASIFFLFISFAHLWGTLGWLMQCSVMSSCGSYNPTIAYVISIVLILSASVLLVIALEKSASLK